MTPSHYEEVPRNVAEELLAKAQGKQPVKASAKSALQDLSLLAE